MTPIASVLTVATVFISVWTLMATFYSQRRRGLIRKTECLCRNLYLKCTLGLIMGGGGGNMGHYSTNICDSYKDVVRD